MSIQIPQAPSDFNGTIEEFYEKYAKYVLIPPNFMEKFHLHLMKYLNSKNPIYLVRNVKNNERSIIISTSDGSSVRLTDNAPAWWLHYQFFTGEFRNFVSFNSLVESIPCELLAIKLKGHVNNMGWHVAHIYDVKNGNTDLFNWTKDELRIRMVRNLHPCNYFYIAKFADSWRQFGGEDEILSFFYVKFEERYQSIWNEFLEVINDSPIQKLPNANQFRYGYSSSKIPQPAYQQIQTQESTQLKIRQLQDGRYVVQYKFSRLCFKKEVINPLQWDDRFCVITPVGDFMMTKREFYETFPNVVRSNSYQESGIYHYPNLPKKALRFLVNSQIH